MGQFYSLENWKTNFTFPTSARPLKEKVFVQQSVSLGRRQDHPGGHSSLWHGLIHFVCVCVCVPHKYTVHTQREPAMSRPSTVLSSSSYQEEGLGYANMFLPQGLWIRGCEQCKEVLFTVNLLPHKHTTEVAPVASGKIFLPSREVVWVLLFPPVGPCSSLFIALSKLYCSWLVCFLLKWKRSEVGAGFVSYSLASSASHIGLGPYIVDAQNY